MATRGIPGQVKKLNERIDALEKQIREEVLPEVEIAKAKADAAIETASKALDTARRQVSAGQDTK